MFAQTLDVVLRVIPVFPQNKVLRSKVILRAFCEIILTYGILELAILFPPVMLSYGVNRLGLLVPSFLK